MCIVILQEWVLVYYIAQIYFTKLLLFILFMLISWNTELWTQFGKFGVKQYFLWYS